LVKVKGSEVAKEAVIRIGRLYKIEREIAGLTAQDGLDIRQTIAEPHWDELTNLGSNCERRRVPDGTTTAKAIDYRLRRSEALTPLLARWQRGRGRRPHRDSDAAMGNGEEKRGSLPAARWAASAPPP